MFTDLTNFDVICCLVVLSTNIPPNHIITAVLCTYRNQRSSLHDDTVMAKVKVILEQATKAKRGSSTISITSALEGDGQRHALAALPQEKTRYPLYRRLGSSQSRTGLVRKNIANIRAGKLGSDSRQDKAVFCCREAFISALARTQAPI
jgi:hypothetical protein